MKYFKKSKSVVNKNVNSDPPVDPDPPKPPEK